MTNIQPAIASLFTKHRIVFWFDTGQEMYQEYETLMLPGIEMIELQNNEFWVKYHILREQPNQKFLIYHAGPQPEDRDNWLLDVQLAEYVFSADQLSIWITETGLRPEFGGLAQEHAEFFKTEPRRSALRMQLRPEDNHDSIRMKMLSICAGSGTSARTEEVLEVLLAELGQDRDEKIALIQRCGLEGFMWKELKSHFNYDSETKSLMDFTISLFKSGYALSLKEPAALNEQALLFLKQWKDSIQYQPAFDALSAKCEQFLGIKKDLERRDARDLIEIDLFKLVDQRILSDLVEEVSKRTIALGECSRLIWTRRSTHWFREFADIYEAVEFGAKFLDQLTHASLTIESLADGVVKYRETWFRIDQFYRKFVHHLREAKRPTILQSLATLVENQYTNAYLRKVNDNWQHTIDPIHLWDAAPVPSQGMFFNRYLGEYLNTKNKVAVIISDALRYEVGEELARRIEEEDRYTAELEPILSMLPSYTQMGMAALLPHKDISISGETVLVDGKPSGGLDNRSKILNEAVPAGAATIKAEDFLTMSRDESRELVKTNQVIYIYQNMIDAVGDKAETEERVFHEVERCIEELLDLVRKLTNANITNLIITADHGFIYENHEILEDEFVSKDVEGADVINRNRRFVIGRNLQAGMGFKEFKPTELGLSGDYQVIFPKSINRRKLQGSGAKYVHGGLTLQEVVIPVIQVNKKRSSDITQVNVEIFEGQTRTITTGQIPLTFYQREAVTEKVQSRRLRAGFFASDGTQISDVHLLDFNLVSTDPRERELKVKFTMKRDADKYNDQTVYLKLEEPIPGTAFYKEYRSLPYPLKRSFTADFD